MSELFQRLMRFVRPLPQGSPDWASLVRENGNLWSTAMGAAASGSRVLMATSTGGHPAVVPIDGLLSAALTVRGANVELLLCDRVLPACVQTVSTQFSDQWIFAERGPQETLCEGCFGKGEGVYSGLGLPLNLYRSLLTPGDFEEAARLAGNPVSELKTYRREGCSIGEHALAGALRYFARGTLEEEPTGEKVFRRYFEAAILTYLACSRLFDTKGYDVVVCHHGIYVPMGIIAEVARIRSIRVVTWNPAYRTGCFIFSHRETYHHTLMTEKTSDWETSAFEKSHEGVLMRYLESRKSGKQDWIFFHEKPQEDFPTIAASLGLDLRKPMIGILTNVAWDAQLHYPANLFPTMFDWVVETLRYFQKRTDLQVVVRVHPAEIRGTVPSRQLVTEELLKRIPDLSRSKHIFVIPPESRVSTYAVMEKCNSVIIYGTKTGVELTAQGVPVIVAGEAWIRNKGITVDPHDRDAYFEALDRLPVPGRMPPAQIERARRYAYHFFFRRMIPLSFAEKAVGLPYRVNVKDLTQLRPGVDPGMDVLCEGILNGRPFIYPAESMR